MFRLIEQAAGGEPLVKVAPADAADAGPAPRIGLENTLVFSASRSACVLALPVAFYFGNHIRRAALQLRDEYGCRFINAG